VNALGGFTGAVLLAAFAVLMAAGSIDRLINPAHIAIDYAILVAAVGLAVNGVCVVILNANDHGHDHAGEGVDHPHGHAHRAQHGDHNLRAAYLHVLADALTSVLAILALLSAKYLGFTWMDPVMGIVGAVLVARWSVGLMRSSSIVLLDRRGPSEIRERIVASVESDGDSRVADIHLVYRTRRLRRGDQRRGPLPAHRRRLQGAHPSGPRPRAHHRRDAQVRGAGERGGTRRR